MFSNAITDEGALNIASLIKINTNKSLKILNLDYNKIGNIGAVAIGNAIG